MPSASVGQPEPPLVVPVRVGTRSGSLRIGAAIVVTIGLVAFVAGYRLGSAQQPVAALPVVTAAPNVTAPPPRIAPAPSPDFQPLAISQRLRGAISAAGTGDYTEADVGTGKSPPWVVCAVDADPRCGVLAFEALDRAYSDIAYGTADEWAGLTPVTFTGRHFILAAVLEETVVGAILVRLAADGNPSLVPGPFGQGSPDSRLLQPVDPDQRGIEYLDLGILTPGRYIVAAGGLSPTFLYGAPGVTTVNAYESRSDIAAITVIP
jgi:hypothetical protein